MVLKVIRTCNLILFIFDTTTEVVSNCLPVSYTNVILINKELYLPLHHLEKEGTAKSPFFSFKETLKGVKGIEKRVEQLVREKIAEQPDLFIVDIRMHPNGRLLVLLDGDNGVTIQDCAAVSRHVGFHLEEENLIGDAYNIEVSSPGIDAPLTSDRQYRKNIGRTVHITMTDGSRKEGRLLEVAADSIQIEEQVKEKGKKAVREQNTVPLSHIAEIKVLISFK